MNPATEARKRLTHRFIQSVRENDGYTPLEADADLNDASRAMIAAVKAQHGTAWLGKINFYDDDRHGGHPVMWEWGTHHCESCSPDGDLIYNFGAAFVAPTYDDELVRLIRERDDAVYTGTRDDATRLEVIMTRLDAIGGVYLHWS